MEILTRKDGHLTELCKWNASKMIKFFNKILPGLFFIALVCAEVNAQQYPITHYTKDRGLPGNQVWAIYQDSKGYMWFGTSAGLIKYNGKEYKFFGTRDGLAGDWQFAITEDRKEKNIWCTYDRGVSKIKEGKVTNWALTESLDRFRIYADGYERIWVYSYLFPGDCYYFKNDSLHNFSTEFNFKSQLIANITEDQRGGVCFITKDGKLYRYFADQISEIKIDGITAAGVQYAFFDSKNNLIVCAEKGLGFISYKTLDSHPLVQWILNFPINFGLQSKQGWYWFASKRDGLIRIKNLDAGKQEILFINENNGLLSNDIKFIFEDYESNIWIGYNLKGISKLSTLMFRKYGSSEGFNANAVLSISGSQNIKDQLFCSTEQGLFRFLENPLGRNNFQQIISPGKFANRVYLSMLPISGQEILLGSAPGLYKLQNSSIQFFGLDNGIVRTLMKDHSGKVWIGTHKGVFTLEKENIFTRQEFDVGDKSISKMLEVNNKDLYICTDKGLFIIENGTSPFGEEKIIHSPQRDKLPSDYISDITVDPDGYIIISSVNGISIMNEKREIEALKELKDVIVLHFDKNNRLWAGTNTGLYILQKQNKTYTITSRFSQREGLASDEFTINNTFYEDDKGKIYFGSYNGLTIYDPAEDFMITAKPKSYISRVEINDSLFSFQDASGIELSPTQNKVSFYCEALSFFNEDAVKFEYYLSPVEKEWSNISPSPKISFGYLKANNYTFYVRAVNQFGIRSEPQKISFTILLPFWERPWFITMSVIFLVFAGYQVNHQRQRHIRKRNLMLEQIVNEKTAKLAESKVQIEEQYNQLVETQKELVEKRELQKAHNEIQLLKDRLAKENIYLRERQGIIQEVSSIIGRSTVVQEIRRKVIEIAPTDTIVLITGDTGVGKNLVAEAIHDLSPRKNRALISVNCAAIPESLVESELFGHEKGAFTGATDKHEGKFEIADGSTIFLDEIGDMPQSVQAKVLSVLQSQKFMRVGGSHQIKTNVRIIAATNQDLSRLVRAGHFRQDLYYRINVYTIHISPIRERIEDIEPLAKYFIERFAKIFNKKIDSITKSAIKKLEGYQYPGNTRELENIIHRALIIVMVR